MTIAIGQPAPDFSLPTDGGGSLSLADLRGKKAVIYFYPKDNTPGCTMESQDFRDLYAEFRAAGCEVVGVSKDSVKSHDGFKAKYTLPFPLISDGDGTMCAAFGVWQEKKNYGKTYMGIVRSTFLLDAGGVARSAWSPVKVKDHARAVLDAAKAL